MAWPVDRRAEIKDEDQQLEEDGRLNRSCQFGTSREAKEQGKQDAGDEQTDGIDQQNRVGLPVGLLFFLPEEDQVNGPRDQEQEYEGPAHRVEPGKTGPIHSAIGLEAAPSQQNSFAIPGKTQPGKPDDIPGSGEIDPHESLLDAVGIVRVGEPQ